MMLKEFVHMAQPKRILEVGMFVGNGAVAMMEGCPTTEVVSLEIDPYLKKWLSDCLEKFPDFLKRHEVVLGPALDSLPKLTGQFDMVFVDANKSEYKRYVEVLLEKDLLAPGATIFNDNVLYNGYPYLSSHFDAQPARRAFGNDIREFNSWVCQHPELEQVMLPIRDGVSIVRKKSDVGTTSKTAPTTKAQAGYAAPTVPTSEAAAEKVATPKPVSSVPAPMPAAENMAASGGYVGRFDGTHSKHASPAMAAAGAGSGAVQDVTALPTSTKWSVLSSRIEGLAAELCQVVGGMDAYCVSMSNAEGAAMRAVREKMLSTPWAQEWERKRTMFSYGEEMSTDPLEAMMLKLFVHMAKPKRVLEVGMFVGFGAVAMMEGSPSTSVTSLEIDPYLKGWLQDCLQPFPEILKRHEIVLGPALDSLPKLTGQFDMVFVDANKAEYKRYVELMLERDLIAPGGTIVCDNVLYNGYPYVPSHFDSQPARRGFGNDIRDFNRFVYEHPELEQVVLPIRDGVSILRRKNVAPQAAPPAPKAAVVEPPVQASPDAVKKMATTQLEHLRTMTSIVADTGDFDAIRAFAPEDCTTNPSLLLAAAKMPKFLSDLEQAAKEAQAETGTGDVEALVSDICDRFAVKVGLRLLELLPKEGRVSTEVD